MARTTRDDDHHLYGAVRDMLTALEFESPATAIKIGKKALRPRQDRTLHAIAETSDESTDRVDALHRIREEDKTRKRERHRRELFKLTRPGAMLAPANVVAVFLRDQPMWGSWSWSDTGAVNAVMLPVAQRLNPGDPPSDPRLALPFTVAGFMLHRAFHLGPARRRLNFDKLPELWLDVYREVAQGLVILNGCLLEAARLKVNGEEPEAFLDDFTDAVDGAETLLLHAIRLGPEIWNLILECPRGAECLEGTPYYVVAPPRKDAKRAAARVSTDDWHPRCRVAKTRASKKRKDVTVTRRHKKLAR